MRETRWMLPTPSIWNCLQSCQSNNLLLNLFPNLAESPAPVLGCIVLVSFLLESATDLYVAPKNWNDGTWYVECRTTSLVNRSRMLGRCCGPTITRTNQYYLAADPSLLASFVMPPLCRSQQRSLLLLDVQAETIFFTFLHCSTLGGPIKAVVDDTSNNVSMTLLFFTLKHASKLADDSTLPTIH